MFFMKVNNCLMWFDWIKVLFLILVVVVKIILLKINVISFFMFCLIE